MDVRLSVLSAEVGGEVVGDGNLRLTGLASLGVAGPNDLAFGRPLHGARAAGSGEPDDQGRSSTGMVALTTTRAGAVVVTLETDPSDVAEGVALLRVTEPETAFNRIARAHGPRRIPLPAGAHPTAIIADSAFVDPTAAIGPYVVVESEARIGPRTEVGAHGYIGNNVSVGEDCRFFPHVVVREYAEIGDRVVLEPGVVIGSDGFGWEAGPRGPQRVPQVGCVVIEDDVEIGANSTIDRARLDETRVGRGSKLDNLVQLGHNVTVGEFCLFAAQVGAGGSTSFGSGVEVGGQVGFAGHVHLGDGCRFAAQSGVMRDTEPKTVWMGSPISPLKDEIKSILRVQQLDALFKRVKKLERQLAEQASENHAQ